MAASDYEQTRVILLSPELEARSIFKRQHIVALVERHGIGLLESGQLRHGHIHLFRGPSASHKDGRLGIFLLFGLALLEGTLRSRILGLGYTQHIVNHWKEKNGATSAGRKKKRLTPHLVLVP